MLLALGLSSGQVRVTFRDQSECTPSHSPPLVIAADADRHAISVRVAKRISVNVGEPERKPITNRVRVAKPEPEPVRNGIDFGLRHIYCVYISYAFAVRELLRLPLSV